MPRVATEAKYLALVKWAYQQSSYDLNSETLVPIIHAFLDNIDRLRAISLMPAVIVAHASGKGNKPEGLASGAADAEAYIASIPVVGDGFKPFFSSVVSGAWTAFEAVATDLWIASVNARTSLATNAMKATRKGASADATKEESDTAKQKANPQVVRVDLLAKYKFDFKNQVGYIVWREDRLGFNTLKDLQHTYRAAFGQITQKWFNEPLHADLVYLEAMRQVIVHRGGKVDDYFRERVTDHPVLSKLKTGDPLPLDGEMAAKNAELALVCGFKLVNSVDDWLMTNPE